MTVTVTVTAALPCAAGGRREGGKAGPGAGRGWRRPERGPGRGGAQLGRRGLREAAGRPRVLAPLAQGASPEPWAPWPRFPAWGPKGTRAVLQPQVAEAWAAGLVLCGAAVQAGELGLRSCKEPEEVVVALSLAKGAWNRPPREAVIAPFLSHPAG